MNIKLNWGFQTREKALSELNRAIKSLFGEVRGIEVIDSWKEGREHNTILNVEGGGRYPKIVDIRMYRERVPRINKMYWFVEISFFLDVEREEQIKLARMLLDEELKYKKGRVRRAKK